MEQGKHKVTNDSNAFLAHLGHYFLRACRGMQ